MSFERAQAQYDAQSPPEPDICPTCGDNLDSEGKCENDDCDTAICCYPERCYCGHPDV